MNILECALKMEHEAMAITGTSADENYRYFLYYSAC